MTYRTCKLCIQKKLYKSKEDMQSKLDVFLAVGRLTVEEYQELTELLAAQE